MLDLNGCLWFSLKATKDAQCTIKWQRWCTLRFTWLNYEHVSAVEGATGSSGGTPTFEAEIKGALGVTIESHLKINLAVHLLVQKSSQNNSIKDEIWGSTLCCT